MGGWRGKREKEEEEEEEEEEGGGKPMGLRNEKKIFVAHIF
jgi:hypothetical protein